VRPSENQIDDLLEEIRLRIERQERVLITTLTKRMAEELSEFLLNHGVRTAYIHSDVATLDRVQILEKLRNGEFDVLVGVNLLREGLDLPEVSLVAILDADKEGFLRNRRSLVQTAGRAARNVNGRVIMYADTITRSMQETIDETNRRRTKQLQYNEQHGITPKQIQKALKSSLTRDDRPDIKELKSTQFATIGSQMDKAADPIEERMTRPQLEKLIAETTRRMKEAAKQLDFLQAAQYRDEIIRLQKEIELK
jgi:excinuclease ABC subunit B